MSQAISLRASAEDRAMVAVPPWPQWPTLAAKPSREPFGRRLSFLGKSLEDMRLQARQSALAAARQFLRQQGEPVPNSPTQTFVLAGHQPELFHPGVWVKHFALNGLARHLQASPLNLLIDSDTVKSCALSVPAGRQLLRLPFDVWQEEAPYEERRVVDEDFLADLPGRLAPLSSSWGFMPLLPVFWEEVKRQREHNPLLGMRLAAARRAWERRWNCHNLEVPQSLLCQTEPFAWFACHLLVNLAAFHDLYNRLVRDYRLAHRIRSQNHPVPDLDRDDAYLEAPFWAWRAGEKRRRRLFVRPTPGGFALRAEDEPWPSLEWDGRSSPQLIDAFQNLERRGFKIRTRALTTTLFARLFLADLFIHGIGGGTYDVLTDGLLRGFYEVEPSPFVILSATLLLPLPRFPVTPLTLLSLRRLLRDLHCNPQRHLQGMREVPAQARRLAEEKQQWIKAPQASSTQRRERFGRLHQLTRQLQPFLEERMRTLQDDLEDCQEKLQENALAGRRDYSFVLYPETLLRSFCQQFLAVS